LTNVPRINRDLISIAHTPGGMMEVVIALLALQSGLIIPEVFVAIVFGAIFSSVLMGPWMARSMARRTATSAAQFLLPDAIVAELKTTTRADAISKLAERATPRFDDGRRRQITDGAMARERDFGTAIGDGIAIPHVRIEGLKNPVLAYGRSSEGIDWDAPDGGLVHHVFFLATPVATADLHVQILASIARAMEAPASRQDIINAPDSAALFRRLSVLLAMQKPGRPPSQSVSIDKA
jgi:mannitol/fructose-specific phosphotransferase system IIA component (Ntr-type)